MFRRRSTAVSQARTAFFDAVRGASSLAEINVAAGVAHEELARIERPRRLWGVVMQLTTTYVLLNATSTKVKGPLDVGGNWYHVDEHVRILHRTAVALAAFVS